jgi:hypothetical protein
MPEDRLESRETRHQLLATLQGQPGAQRVSGFSVPESREHVVVLCERVTALGRNTFESGPNALHRTHYKADLGTRSGGPRHYKADLERDRMARRTDNRGPQTCSPLPRIRPTGKLRAWPVLTVLLSRSRVNGATGGTPPFGDPPSSLLLP